MRYSSRVQFAACRTYVRIIKWRLPNEGSATPRKSVRDLKSYKDFEGFLGFFPRFLCTKTKISDVVGGGGGGHVAHAHSALCSLLYAHAL